MYDSFAQPNRLVEASKVYSCLMYNPGGSIGGYEFLVIHSPAVGSDTLDPFVALILHQRFIFHKLFEHFALRCDKIGHSISGVIVDQRDNRPITSLCMSSKYS